MINKKVQDALNRQCNREMYSAYLYLSMSAYFQSVNLKGFANWMRVQTQEEMVHAMKFYDFVNDRGGKVTLHAIEAPPTEWASPLAAFEDAYKHEQQVTSRINDLTSFALESKDHATHIFLQWFVTEQVEEEKSAADVIQKLRQLEQAPGMLFMLDNEMGGRTAGAAGGES